LLKPVATRSPALRRNAWHSRIQRCIDHYGDNTLLLICDVDHFKDVNDTMSHAAGDVVLIATAVRLTA
jgi:diguanylate cyclase (GGDEF)-like protein